MTAIDATRFRERCARLQLLLVLAHTVPVIWLTPVAGGTAPTVALLAVGLAGLFSFDTEGLALGLMALLPGLLYLGLGWVISWVLARAIARRRRTTRLIALAVLTAVPLACVYLPIYVAGGHNSSSSANLLELVDGFPHAGLFVAYWAALHLVIAGLLAVQVPADGAPGFRLAARWTLPALRGAAVGLAVALAYANRVDVICRPFAELGSDAAEVCVGRAGGPEARYFYERAAADGNAEALAWVVANTPDRNRRREWLERGAALGDAASRFGLAEHFRRYGGGDAAEADRLVEAAAAQGYAPARLALAEALATQAVRTGSADLLARRNALLEEAAASGSPAARSKLAEHYTRGSMGYPVDLTRARSYYDGLLQEGEMTVEESPTVMMGDSYRARLAELDAWQRGLAAADAEVMLKLARLYLASPLPGPGVRQRGMELFGEVAENDPAVRAELIMMLRTGTGGVDKDLDGSRELLLAAARAGDAEAMARVADNYMDGREGFRQDYAASRRWLEALREHYRSLGGGDADRHIAALQNDLRYLDRLGEMAGGELLGADALAALGRRPDAESQYRYALQLLAGGGTARRGEAVARLQAAAELGHGGAAWRLVEVYERGFVGEIDEVAARRELERAAALHHYDAVRELASRLEYGSKGYAQDLPRAIAMYEDALAAGRDNRYGWNLTRETFNHFPWLESRLKQARLKLDEQLTATAS